MARVVVSSARGYPTWVMGCCLGKAVFRASTLSVLHSSYSSVLLLEYSVLSPLMKSNLSPFRMAGLLGNRLTDQRERLSATGVIRRYQKSTLAS